MFYSSQMSCTLIILKHPQNSNILTTTECIYVSHQQVKLVQVSAVTQDKDFWLMLTGKQHQARSPDAG